MNKRAVALVLSVAIISTNLNQGISYAAEYIQDNINKEESLEIDSEVKSDYTITESNTHEVHSTQELIDAINTAVEGDVIKIHDGEYTEENITITTPGITLKGYTSTNEPINEIKDAVLTRANLTINASNVNINGISTKNMYIGKGITVEHVSINNSQIYNDIYIGQGKNGLANYTKVENTKVEKYMYLGHNYGVANNTTLRGVNIYNLEASGPYAGTSENTIIENCEVRNLGRITGNNFEIINSYIALFHLSGNNSTVNNSSVKDLYLGNYDNANNITIKNTNIQGAAFIGQREKIAKDILLDNVVASGAMIGYKGGIAENITITNSTMHEAISIGRSTKGTAINTKVYNTSCENLFIGADDGISKNTMVINSEVPGRINIGVSEGKADNTLVQTNSIMVNNGGTNTTIVRDILSNSNKLLGEASKGMRIEVLKDGDVYINKTIADDRKIDSYFKEDDQDFTFNTGEEINIKVYNDQDSLIFDEIIIVKRNTIAPSTPIVNNINNTSTSIKGTAQPNTTVVATIDGKEIGRAKSNKDESFEILLDYPIKEDTNIEIYAIDKEENKSNSVVITVGDVIRPDAPIVDEVTTKSKSITGKAEANATVKVTLTRDGSKYSYESKANNEGNFNVILDRIVRKNDTIEIYTQDKAGNKSDTIIVNINVVLPQRPVITNQINNASSKIFGTAGANNTIKAYINDELVITSPADNKGSFTMDIPWSNEYNVRIPAGTSIEFVAIDEDNDTSESTTIVVVDVRPNPVKEIDEITNISKNITGKAQPNKQVIALIDRQVIGRATTDANGNFNISLSNNIEENTVVEFIVEGENNILSEIKSTTVKDASAPIIEEISTLNNKEQVLTGKSEAGSIVVALREGQVEGDSDVITTTVEASGQFRLQFTNLKKGEVVRVYAKDKAGNRSDTVEVIVSNKIAPSLTVEKVQNIDTTIKGSTEPNSHVSAILKLSNGVDKKEIGNTVADKEGNFTIELNQKLNYNDKVLIRVVDVDQNVTEKEIKVDDMIAPTFVSVDKINNRTKVIAGKVSEAGAKVSIDYYDNKGNLISNLGEVESDKDGNFKIDVPTKLSESYEIKLRVSDTAGNYSDSRVTIGYVKEFKDIETHWAKEEIYSFIEKGYISGYLDNTFRPNDQITRAEFVKIVNGVFGYTEKGRLKFTDVKEKDWYYNDVAIAVKAGYINGKSETIFDPKAPITRQEAAKIIATIKNCADDNFDKIDKFNDKSSVANWAKPCVEGVIEAGYMGGYSDNTFRPNQKITRAEAVVTLQRTIK